MKSTINDVLVSIITYKRPAALDALLVSLSKSQTTVQHRILVVDNDPSESARRIVAKFPDVQYDAEPKAGIAAARNRCLSNITATDQAIVFIDDDETVQVDWLQNLVDCANYYRADIVAGPVMSRLPPGVPNWIRTGNFFQRRVRPTGTTSGIPATNNVLVRTETLDRNPDIRFDDSFSLTGGSDTDFFSRLRASGASIVWCATALVEEELPLDRLTLSWLIRRYTRGGEVHARIRLRSSSTLRVGAEGLALAALGILALPVTLIALWKFRGKNLVVLCRGIGILRTLRGKHLEEYARQA